ncbi:MAG: hypothetical protein IIY82_02815, partial [Firmicutes bacterium]|nr:hypothetical protein [Bacillota bacterium]
AAIPEINQDGFILVRNEYGEIDYCYSTDGFVSYYQDINQDVVGVVDGSLGYGYCYITEDLLQFGDCFYIPGYGYASPIGLVNQYTFPSYDVDGTPMDADPYFKCAVTFPTEEEAKAFRYHGTIYPGTFQ